MTWPRPPPEPSLARTTEGRRSSMPLVSPIPVGQEASSPPHPWRGSRRPLFPLCCSLVEVQNPAGLCPASSGPRLQLLSLRCRFIQQLLLVTPKITQWFQSGRRRIGSERPPRRPSVTPGGEPRLWPRLHNVPRPRPFSADVAVLMYFCANYRSEMWTQ